MDRPKVVEELSELYPGVNLFINDENNPTEIVAETDPEHGVAVAVIDRSVEHHHNHTVEKYVVQRGLLELYIDGNRHDLKEGDEIEIQPGHVHYAVGNETWVECTSTPPWSPEDHILENNK